MARAFLGLGSNLGDRSALLAEAVDRLVAVGRRAVSPLYETEPVGGPEQGRYLNLVVELDTDLSPRQLLAVCGRLEAAADRVRDERWGPRTLDVDIVAYAGVVSDDPQLTLPHPRAHERAFVLAPWYDVEPEAEWPGRGAIAGLLDAVTREGVAPRKDLELHLPE
jgi:2-amino-4-hydroxy-6-hydroxymethyldihydropteridine diphosphokinase